MDPILKYGHILGTGGYDFNIWHNSAYIKVEFISLDICGQKWKTHRHRPIDCLSSRVKKGRDICPSNVGMLSSRTAQDEQSSGLILLWFEWSSFRQSRNNIRYRHWFPFPFHFQRTGILRAQVELSGMGAGWTHLVHSQRLDAPVTSAKLSAQGEGNELFLCGKVEWKVNFWRLQITSALTLIKHAADCF